MTRPSHATVECSDEDRGKRTFILVWFVGVISTIGHRYMQMHFSVLWIWIQCVRKDTTDAFRNNCTLRTLLIFDWDARWLRSSNHKCLAVGRTEGNVERSRIEKCPWFLNGISNSILFENKAGASSALLHTLTHTWMPISWNELPSNNNMYSNSTYVSFAKHENDVMAWHGIRRVVEREWRMRRRNIICNY